MFAREFLLGERGAKRKCLMPRRDMRICRENACIIFLGGLLYTTKYFPENGAPRVNTWFTFQLLRNVRRNERLRSLVCLGGEGDTLSFHKAGCASAIPHGALSKMSRCAMVTPRGIVI